MMGSANSATDMKGNVDDPRDHDVICVTSQPDDETWSGHKGNILLKDLVCLHHLLWNERNATPPSDAEIDELAARLVRILSNGPDYVFPEAEGLSQAFLLKGQARFLEEVQQKGSPSWKEADKDRSREFVADMIRDAIKTEASGKDVNSAANGSKPGPRTKQEKDEGRDKESGRPAAAQRHGDSHKSPKLKPVSQDIILLKRGVNKSDSEQVGNERFLSLVDQYVCTAIDEGLLTTSSSEKRAQAALAIVDSGKSTGQTKMGDPRFLLCHRGVRGANDTSETEDVWQEVERSDAAEITLILLFEKYLEKKLSQSAANLAKLDFSEPGTIPIPMPNSHDVLFGRGGLTNNHPGNRRFRDVISLHRQDYARAIKIEKPNVARRIVKAIRSGSPPGRFLKKNSTDEMWYDVGDKNAAEKTSQALREKIKKGKVERTNLPEQQDRKRDVEKVLPRLPDPRSTRLRLDNEPNESSGATASHLVSPNPHPMTHQSYVGVHPPHAGLPLPQFGPYGVAVRMQKAQNGQLTGPSNRESTDAREKESASQARKNKGKKAGGKNSSGSKEGKNGKCGSVNGATEPPSADASDSGSDTVNPVDEEGNIVVTNHDILCGRGGLTNHHKGNKRFRDIVSLHRPDYVRSAKAQKPAVARLIVRAIRNGDPPGRFLKKDEKTGKWYDIGDKRAAEKASQALREKANGQHVRGDNNNASLAPRPPPPFLSVHPSVMAGALPPVGAAMDGARHSQNVMQPGAGNSAVAGGSKSETTTV